MITRILLAIALAVIATPLRAENQQIWSFDTAGWEGGAYQSPDGRFSHCSISAGYKSGISLAFSITGSYGLHIVLGKADWQLPAGGAYDVALDIDSRPLGRYTAGVLDSIFLSIPLGNDADAFRRLRKGYRLRVSAAREDLYFDLDGTSRALDTLLDCVERANALSSPGNPFADARSTSANPFAGNDSRAGSNDQDIVEGLLLASGLQDIVFVDPATTGFGDALHTWQAGELTGAVYVIDSEGRDLEAMVGVVLGTLAQECQGGFASKPRPVERVRRAQVKQFTAACRAPQYDGDYFYAFTAVSNGEKVMMLYNSSELGAADLEQVNLAMLDALHILLPD